MNHLGKIWLLAVCAAVLMPAAGVHAQAQCGGTVPGDNAQVDEYTETIPGACGDTHAGGAGEGRDSVGEGGSGDGGGAIPPGTAEELQSLGDDGAAAAGLAEASGPPAKTPASNGTQDEGRAAEASDDQGSALGEVARAVTGSDDGGLGILLPLILAGTLIAAVVFVVRRRRHTTQA